MAAQLKYPWIIALDGTHQNLAYAMKCLRCNAMQPITLPLSVDAYVAIAEGFTKHHRYCGEENSRQGTKH
jgi:hypothetical protein